MANPQNSRPDSWDHNNLIESKQKKIMKLNSQSTQCWKMKLRKKVIKKRDKNNSSQYG